MSLQTADPIAQAADILARGDIATAERIAELRLARGVDADTLHLLALVRTRQNRLEEAVGLLRRALDLQPGQAQMLLNLGKVLGLLKRDDEAAKALEEASVAKPDLVEAWHELGEVRQRRGDTAGAETAFATVLALEPQNSLAKLALGVLLKDAQRAEQGAAMLARGFAEVPDGPLKAAFAYNLAFAQYDLGQKEAAMANFTLVRGMDPSRSSNVDLNRANLLCEWSRFEEAEALLQELVQRDPQNDAAHLAYNQLLYVLKREEKFLASYELAPRDTKLRLGKATLLHHAERLAEAEEIYADILADEPDNHDAVTGRAAILAKLGRHAQALECLQQAAARAPGDYRLFTGIAGAALQGGDPERAAAMAEIAVAYSPHDQHMLALLGSAWRLMGDERDELLNGYDELIQVFDLDPPPGFSDMAAFNAELNGWLGTMHPSNREPVHQSLRVGNQTWGKIFGAGHDLVERAKLRISEAMDRYIAGLRPRDGKPFSVHPFTGRRRQGFAFTGSWSSRLGDCGYHVNHIHPRGWISSCYYVGVPEAVKDAQSRQGWIKFGEPRFEIGLKARRTVQPVPGRLVLFPSYMWHGTIPFHGEARTTIAFDAVPR